jgi:hypothetical protein
MPDVIRLDAVTVDDRAVDPSMIVLGRPGTRTAPRLPLTLGAPTIAVTNPEPPAPRRDGGPGLAVQAVPIGRPAMEIDPATRERLRALGYGE